METSEKYSVWVLKPDSTISSTSEQQAVQLLTDTPGSANYIYFFAELTAPEEDAE
jgi:hypothetical protein